MAGKDIYLITASISWEEHDMIRDDNLYSEDIKPYILKKGIKSQKTTPSNKKRKSSEKQHKGYQCKLCAKSFYSKGNLNQQYKP